MTVWFFGVTVVGVVLVLVFVFVLPLLLYEFGFIFGKRFESVETVFTLEGLEELVVFVIIGVATRVLIGNGIEFVEDFSAALLSICFCAIFPS